MAYWEYRSIRLPFFLPINLADVKIIDFPGHADAGLTGIKLLDRLDADHAHLKYFSTKAWPAIAVSG